ncbi:polyphosphate kinase 1 [Desulfurispira natronophila]|uniref:Polyphosphate kinase n=1 Tax=Desulfurispira natronophila TaxID=682562 RepID=A0A7W8DG19_9BACT|nr:polyphosphate kinase 1 [Desulfurispira natronophila]MBB5021016.1 polyphosphate kinase [Desulfurispira natronophila]
MRNDPVFPYINREISWLSFNARVLQEATHPEVPLLERLKFLGIFSSNLDEYFRVRVATVKRFINLGDNAIEIMGDDPRKVMASIKRLVGKHQQTFESTYQQIRRELEEEGIYIIDETQLDQRQALFVQNYFHSRVRPTLFPVMLDHIKDFPNLYDGNIYFAISLGYTKKSEVRHALLKIPTDVLSRFLVFPPQSKRQYIILLDDVIRYCLKDIFAMFDFDTFAAYTIKITRDAELDIEDTLVEGYLDAVSRSLKKRKEGQPVRMVYDRQITTELLRFITRRLKLTRQDSLIAGSRYHNFKDFIGFPDVGSPSLRYEPLPPLPHYQLAGQKRLLACIRVRDIMLHFPYQSFHYILDLLREAAIDPQVTAISMTLYRLAQNSMIVNALKNAVRNGKKVTVVIELQARFDEKANIYWAQKLEENSVTVIYGVPGFKVHSKLCHITRLEDGRKVHYSAIGTGNFNESTARIYCDDTLLTADPRVTTEVEKVFAYLKDNSLTPTFRHLLVAPFNMRQRFMEMLDHEISEARQNRESWCIIKVNSLVDRAIVSKLYEASQAGVKIRLIVRGICSLVKRKGFSDNIEAISIVDRFLEHSRVYFFHNSGQRACYIGSADWMRRNLSNRVEVITPVYDEQLQQEMWDMLQMQWQDNCRARILNSRQSNPMRKIPPRQTRRRSQYDSYEYFRRRS